MPSENENTILKKRKQDIISALCKSLSLDPKDFLDDKDIKSLCTNILMNNDELLKWIAFAEDFPVDSVACFRSLNGLNEELITKSVLVGGGMKPSEADIIVFSALHSFVFGLSDSERIKLPHVLRWMDYIQNSEDFGEIFEKIYVEKPDFDPPQPKIAEKVEIDPIPKKTVQGMKDANSSEAGMNTKKNDDMKKVAGDKQTAAEKKKVPEKQAEEKDKDISISLLKIQVGFIRKACKHPSADSLLVEEIDIGDAKCRQVVSGLAKYINPDELMNRRVVLITNVKPGKLRDVMSEGLVLCASNDDHTSVEPLIAPEGAKIGECVTFSGHEGKPEDVLNPKKKQFEKITPYLSTDDKGVAVFKGIPFMTSGGPCTSSIRNAIVK